ncbi:MAG: putative toxin-antitoxin system toxin component, PIN family [Candidatus Tectomicrobia bacterium]|nr:putative toxin-antitoxin system toxin component, PIN family [Candidatus Tectomicrobia bacterium]
MPLNAVLDSVVLISAFLTPGGVADAVLQGAIENRFTCFLSEDIIAETTRRLLSPRLQQRYGYETADVEAFGSGLRASFDLVTDMPVLSGVVRDPNDDMIVACAVAASADYLVSRDDDLLSLENYDGITMMTPEAFMAVLRDETSAGRDEETGDADDGEEA